LKIFKTESQASRAAGSGLSAFRERIFPDAGDWQAIDCAGDGHSTNTARTSVSRDGDRAVIGRVNELGLHCGGASSRGPPTAKDFEAGLVWFSWLLSWGHKTRRFYFTDFIRFLHNRILEVGEHHAHSVIFHAARLASPAGC
jgi:hypothetical protein